MIPYTLFFLTREASVKAFIGTTQLPDAAIKAVEEASGVTGVYKKIHYRACGFPFHFHLIPPMTFVLMIFHLMQSSRLLLFLGSWWLSPSLPPASYM
jgi:hypothetical protein